MAPVSGSAPLQDWQRRRRKPSLPHHPPDQPLTGRQWFRLTREHRNLTLTELSKLTGEHHSCTRSFLNHLEGGRLSLESIAPERKAALQHELKLTEEEWTHGISGNATMKDIG